MFRSAPGTDAAAPAGAPGAPGAEGAPGTGPPNTTSNRRLQQTQAQVEEVRMSVEEEGRKVEKGICCT